MAEQQQMNPDTMRILMEVLLGGAGGGPAPISGQGPAPLAPPAAPPLLPEWLAPQALAAGARRGYSGARDAAAGALGVTGQTLGAGPEGDPGAYAQHEQTAQLLTEMLMGLGLPGSVAGGGVTAAGNFNESMAALFQLLSGGDMFGPAGLDINDLNANERGINKAREKNKGPSTPSITTGVRG